MAARRLGYGNHAANAAKYDEDEVVAIKDRIKRAVQRHGVEIAADRPAPGLGLIAGPSPVDYGTAGTQTRIGPGARFAQA